MRIRLQQAGFDGGSKLEQELSFAVDLYEVQLFQQQLRHQPSRWRRQWSRVNHTHAKGGRE
jgi:hypothetical protein